MVKKVVMPAAGQTTDIATVTKLCVSVGDKDSMFDPADTVAAGKRAGEFYAEAGVSEKFQVCVRKISVGILPARIRSQTKSNAAGTSGPMRL